MYYIIQWISDIVMNFFIYANIIEGKRELRYFYHFRVTLTEYYIGTNFSIINEIFESNSTTINEQGKSGTAPGKI